jgi:putative intracellular protease/amidase
MKKEIIFVLLQQYADWEGAFIASYLNNAKGLNGEEYETNILSVKKEPVVSIGGFQTLPDYDIASMPDKYEALILVGGMSWFKHEAETLVPVVSKAIKNNILVAAICNASVFLGKHGFLNEVKHTSNTLEYLTQKAGVEYTGKANYVEKQAICDKNIITANGTGELEFAKEIQLYLRINTPEEIEKQYSFYKFGLYKE